LRSIVWAVALSVLVGATESDSAEKILKIACIGNSITYGAGIQDRINNSYPAQLQRMLGKGWDVRNFGSSGRTLLQHGDYPYRNEREFEEAKNFGPDVVIMKLGTNDSKPQNWKYKDEFVVDYEALIDDVQKFPSLPRVYLCTPVPAFPGDWGISDSVIRNDVIPRLLIVAGRKRVSIIDLYSALTGKAEFFPDRVHPDKDGARLMAKTIYDTICRDYSMTKAPEPFGAVPTIRQLAWQDLEYCGFVHFTVNTFTNKEWGYGDESPSLFNPSDFNADEIAAVARNVGMKGLILTCKHHDGFCLWPSQYTEHSVKKSPWKQGKGDVVKELADACRTYGLKFGIYLSPWDRSQKDYGKPEYVAFYRNQLRELLTNYGDISEVWFDGANGGDGYYGGARETRTIDRTTYYGWQETWSLVRQLQPNAVIFSDVGPDVRWVGNENGYAGETCWSTYTPIGERGDAPAPGYTRYQEGIEGHRGGEHWLPPECDVSIRPGWFYHAGEDTSVKTPAALLDLYFRSVGRNASLLLNVPPDRRGRIHDADARALKGLKRLLDATFADNLVIGARCSASEVRGNDQHFAAQNAIDADKESYWATDDSVTEASLIVEFDKPKTFDCIMVQEHIALGQRIEAFSVDVWNEKDWKKSAGGTTVGHKRLLRVAPTTTTKVRLVIIKSGDCPTISNFALYKTPPSR